jgi:hypothetical protein
MIRLQRCYERCENVIDAFFDLADAIITLPSLRDDTKDRREANRAVAVSASRLPGNEALRERTVRGRRGRAVAACQDSGLPWA